MREDAAYELMLRSFEMSVKEVGVLGEDTLRIEQEYSLLLVREADIIEGRRHYEGLLK